MILVRMLGGLGNQMFQYAAGRSLADRLGTELVLDLSLLSGAVQGLTFRPFALEPFALRARMVTAEESTRYQLRDMPLTTWLKTRLLRRHAGLHWVRYFGTRFNTAIVELPDNTCLTGNFQSEQYFSSIAEQIRTDLSFKEPPKAADVEMLDAIRARANAVSVHIRRGDYAANPKTRRVHGLLPTSYYKNAFDYIAARHRDVFFFVFSDDPEWARENVQLCHPHSHVSHLANAAHDDLRLMMECRHHITANSSFSWWSAWLARERDRIVVCPRQWFADAQNQGDVVPDKWVRIDAESGEQYTGDHGR